MEDTIKLTITSITDNLKSLDLYILKNKQSINKEIYNTVSCALKKSLVIINLIDDTNNILHYTDNSNNIMNFINNNVLNLSYVLLYDNNIRISLICYFYFKIEYKTSDDNYSKLRNMIINLRMNKIIKPRINYTIDEVLLLILYEIDNNASERIIDIMLREDMGNWYYQYLNEDSTINIYKLKEITSLTLPKFNEDDTDLLYLYEYNLCNENKCGVVITSHFT